MTPATQEIIVTAVLDMANATIKLLDISASLWKARAEAAEARLVLADEYGRYCFMGGIEEQEPPTFQEWLTLRSHD